MNTGALHCGEHSSVTCRNALGICAPGGHVRKLHLKYDVEKCAWPTEVSSGVVRSLCMKRTTFTLRFKDSVVVRPSCSGSFLSGWSFPATAASSRADCCHLFDLKLSPCCQPWPDLQRFSAVDDPASQLFLPALPPSRWLSKPVPSSLPPTLPGRLTDGFPWIVPDCFPSGLCRQTISVFFFFLFVSPVRLFFFNKLETLGVQGVGLGCYGDEA